MMGAGSALGGVETAVPCEWEDAIDPAGGTWEYGHEGACVHEQVREGLQAQKSGLGLGTVEGEKIVDGVSGGGGRTVIVGSMFAR